MKMVYMRCSAIMKDRQGWLQRHGEIVGTRLRQPCVHGFLLAMGVRSFGSKEKLRNDPKAPHRRGRC